MTEVFFKLKTDQVHQREGELVYFFFVVFHRISGKLIQAVQYRYCSMIIETGRRYRAYQPRWLLAHAGKRIEMEQRRIACGLEWR
jgi:hypothetical protein